MTMKGDGALFEWSEPSRKVIRLDKPQHMAVRLARCVLCLGVHPSRVELVCGKQFPARIAVKFNEMLLGHFVLDTSLPRSSHWAGLS